jgi:hypothetical protein
MRGGVFYAVELCNTNKKIEKRIKGIPLKKLVGIKSVVNTVAFLMEYL